MIRRGDGTGYKFGSDHHRAKYPFEAVEDARRLRLRHLPYTDIAEILGRKYGPVPWLTVRDWCRYATRVRA